MLANLFLLLGNAPIKVRTVLQDLYNRLKMAQSIFNLYSAVLIKTFAALNLILLIKPTDLLLWV